MISCIGYEHVMLSGCVETSRFNPYLHYFVFVLGKINDFYLQRKKLRIDLQRKLLKYIWELWGDGAH